MSYVDDLTLLKSVERKYQDKYDVLEDHARNKRKEKDVVLNKSQISSESTLLKFRTTVMIADDSRQTLAKRIALKAAFTKATTFDDNGKSLIELATSKMVNTRKMITENGKTNYENGGKKGAITRSTTVKDYGRTIIQIASDKAKITRSTFDENY